MEDVDFDEQTWDESIGSYGYGTYALDVFTGSGGSFGIFIPWINTAYKLYIDGNLISSSGTVGSNSKTHKPAYHEQLASFYDDDGEFQIALQVSNYSHYDGGLSLPVMIGTKEAVISRYALLNATSLFVIATMLASAVYMLMLYGKPQREKRLVYIAALAVLLALRTSLGASFILYRIIPWFPWIVGLRIEYMIIPLAVFCFFEFFRHSYPDVFTHLKSSIIVSLSLIGTFLAAVLPMDLLEIYITVIYILLLMAVSVWIYVVVRQRIIISGHQNISIVIGTMAFSIGAVMDTCRYGLSMNLYFPLLFSTIGMMYLVFLLVYDYTNRFLTSLEYNQQLAKNLEKKVSERTFELEQANERLYQMAVRDNLTGLWNRNELKTRKEVELYRYRNHFDPEGSSFTVFYVDIDNFKYYNDTFSHDVGDEILKFFADQLVLVSRRSDTIFRLGGDEFVILMPRTDRDAAVQIAEKLLGRTRSSRESIVNITQSACEDLQLLHCSIGISIHEQGELDIDLLIHHADQALYMAKGKGKNCYCLYENL
jgi:diguanylate cyclase (GGDEF)-like protein